MAGRIANQASVGISSIRVTEAVQDGFVAVLIQLEYRSTIGSAAVDSGSIEIARRVKDQPGIRRGAIRTARKAV